MRKIVIAVLFACLTQFLLAQTRITGQILDSEDKKPVPFAQIAIFSTIDTALISGTTTSTDGNFSIDQVRKGKYIFKAMFTGCTTVEKVIEVADYSKPLALGRIELKKCIELEGVEISEMLIPTIIKGDTVEFNAEAFRAIEGSMLEELIKRMPGFEIDREGNITFQGKAVRHILVDGEEFFSDDPKVAAQNIPADYVQKVQTYNRKSRQAQFTGIDDGNEETVINLVFQPGLSKGWFGRLNIGGGADAGGAFKYNNTFNINYFRDKDQLTGFGNFNNVNDIASSHFVGTGLEGARLVSPRDVMMIGRGNPVNLFRGSGGIQQSVTSGINFVKRFNSKLTIGGNYRYSGTKQESNEEIDRESILSDGTSQFYNEEKTSRRLSNRHTFGSQIRYNPNENNQLIISPSLEFGTGNNEAFTSFKTMDSTLAMLNEGTRVDSSESRNFRVNLRTEYRHRFNKPQRTLSLDLNGGFNMADNTAFNRSFNEFSSRPTDTIDQKAANDSWRYNWGATLIYTEPLMNDFALELRYNISNNENRTEKQTFGYDPITQFYDRKDSLFSNNFGNSSLNQHFTIRLQKNTERYRYTLGFSLINNHNFSYIEGQSDIPQKALNIAPQADFQYRFSPQSTLDLRYSGQTRQPTTEQLQPIPDNSNPLNIRIGNPKLKPEFSHAFSVSQRKSFSNMSSIFSSLSFGMTHNRIANITINDPNLFENIQIDSGIFRPGMYLMMADNVNLVYDVGGSFTYTTPLFFKKITLSTTTGGGLDNSKSLIDKDMNVLNDFSLSENLRINYRAKRFDVSLNGRFIINNAIYSLQPERNNIFYTTSGGADFSWQIIKNKLILSSDFNFSRMDGLSDGHNPRWSVWNAQLSWNYGKTNKGQIRLQVLDILNDNNDTQRYVTPNYIEDITSNVLKRYFLLVFTYNLQSASRPG